jgi:hypothetical protein
MVALVFEVYGAFCFFSLIAFLVLAAVAKLRPDLDEEEFEELEKLKKLANSEQYDHALPNDDPIVEILSLQPPAPPAKRTKRATRRGPHLFHTRKPRTT